MKITGSIASIFERNKTVLSNFSFLSVYQVVNLLLFLILVPFLFRRLGNELYGLVIFAQTIAFYFSILINFGFNISGTRDISLSRNNADERSTVISGIIILKTIFFLISVVLMFLLMGIIPVFFENRYLFFFSMIYCLGEALFPLWYFQGMEKMKYITYINVTTRVLATALIFLLVKGSSDYLLVPLILGIGYLAGSLIGLFIVFKGHGHRFLLWNYGELVAYLRSNIPLFLSTVSSQIYVNANKIIIGAFLGMQQVGIYDAAEKITNLLKVPVLIAGQTLFPKVSKDRNTKYILRLMWLAVIYFIVIYTLLIYFSSPLLQFVTGVTSEETSWLLLLLALSILPVCIGLFYSDLILLALGFIKEYAVMRVSSLLFYFSLTGIIIITGKADVMKMALVIVLTEFYVVLHSVTVCRKKKLI